MRASDLFGAMAAAFDAKPIPPLLKKPHPSDEERLLELSPQKNLAERLKEQIKVSCEQEREFAQAYYAYKKISEIKR